MIWQIKTYKIIIKEKLVKLNRNIVKYKHIITPAYVVRYTVIKSKNALELKHCYHRRYYCYLEAYMRKYTGAYVLLLSHLILYP